MFYLKLRKGKVIESESYWKFVIDYGEDNKIVGVEFIW